MLVFGDHHDRIAPTAKLEELGSRLDRVHRMQPGIARHAALVNAFVEAGRLHQGLADHDFHIAGWDRRSVAADRIGAFVHDLAVAVLHSALGSPDLLPHVPAWSAGQFPEEVTVKVAEGYAFYAVYPEAFAEAAGRLELVAPPRVIGIRSIGSSLAAIVAAALGARAAITVRPHGDPFDRCIRLSPELEEELLAGTAHYIVVDEGPGLSGSSFGSVADWLEERGVPLERIAFICSHAGEPGPEAPVRHRRRWSRVQRSAASFGAELADVVRPWVEERMGSPVTSIADISGGVWRKLQQLDVGEWPAANPALERRKFLLRVNGNQLVARFAGLGEEGERKLQIARELHRLGYGPAPIDLIHGFVVEEWHGDARPVDAGAISAGELSRYIAARAALPLPRPGATLEDLHRMLCRNAELLLGQGAATAADRWRPLLQRLQQRVVPACTDNRLDRCEWLRRTDGSLIKMDAVDHHAAHDLIGCQDLAWDVVGAAVEFELDDAQTQSLASLTAAAAGRAVDAKLLEYLHLAYLAFRGGQAAMARNMTCSADEVRWLARQRSYAKRLNQGLLEERNSATRGFA